MSSTQATASPRAPRAHRPSSRHAAQPSPNTNGNRPQRRNRRDRAHTGSNAAAHQGASANALQDPAHSDSAIFSSEDVAAVPVGPRQPKKHTCSQPSADRVFPPHGAHNASLTDTELGPAHSAATPAKTQGAYAGPTFHASPAPSALPIPKFLSKSVPPKTHTGPPTPPPDEASDPGSSPSPSPSRGVSIPIPSRQQDSPLDLLFRADRAEKARNVNCSPPALPFSSPNMPTHNTRPHHNKHDSFGSLNAPFPIELEANSGAHLASPPPASLSAHRSVTAPSKIPQLEALAQPKGPDPIQDLMNRLSMSHNKPGASTPPRTGPSDPVIQHSPSPFRSTSGPTTPAPSTQAQEDPEVVYGNQNLSNKFKAAQTDSAKRNSGLRTEITADSPIVSQGSFPFTPFTSHDTRGVMGDALNGHGGSRRGSAPHVASIPPYRGGPGNNQNIRSPNRRSYQHSHAKATGPANATLTGPPAATQKPNNPMAFIPSSVRAKPSPTSPRKTETDNLILEQNLKRMLNLAPGGVDGVR